MIVAVTGGTGFIGRHLIARHIAQGDQVRYLTRKKNSQVLGATAYLGDLSASADELQSFVDGADVLYHCAGELQDAAKMHATNVVGTANLLAAAQRKVKRWVQLSSTGVYGIKMINDIDENAALNPANPYEISKAEADSLVLAAINQHNLECAILRPSNVYGVDMPNRSLFQLINMIGEGCFFFIGKSGAIANYIHVENVVDALILCATQKLPANGRVYIVSDDRSLENFVGIIANAIKKRPPKLRLPESLLRFMVLIFGKLPKFPLTASRVDALTNRYRYFTQRIESELGYQHSISMEQGMSELARYAKK